MVFVLHDIADSVRGLDVANRPQCSTFRVIVAVLSLGDVVEVVVGKWMGVKVLCKHAYDTLSHATHVIKVK